jgi:F-type H+-transporting ATPase subunit epsilon
MSDRHYKLEIVTPEKKAYSEQVEFAVFPGSEGELGVLAGHAPLLSRLDPGVIRITRNNTVERLAIAGGFIEVRNNNVSVLAETAEFPREINASAALKAKSDAEEALKNAPTDAARAAATIQLRKAAALLAAAETGPDKGPG